MNNRTFAISAILGGVVMALLSNIPVISFINCLACAGLWLGGGFAVWYYKRQEVQLITAGQGALIGAAGGVVGAILGAILGAIFGGATIATMIAADPTGTLEGALGGAAVAGGFSLLGLLFNIFLYPFFGAIGGAAAATFMTKTKPV